MVDDEELALLVRQGELAVGELEQAGRGSCDERVERSGRELPIRADYVGKNIPTALSESVKVTLTETDGADEVKLLGGLS